MMRQIERGKKSGSREELIEKRNRYSCWPPKKPARRAFVIGILILIGLGLIVYVIIKFARKRK